MRGGKCARIACVLARSAAPPGLKLSPTQPAHLPSPLLPSPPLCSDPVTEFVRCLFVDYDFDGAQAQLAKCEEVSTGAASGAGRGGTGGVLGAGKQGLGAAWMLRAATWERGWRVFLAPTFPTV